MLTTFREDELSLMITSFGEPALFQHDIHEGAHSDVDAGLGAQIHAWPLQKSEL